MTSDYGQPSPPLPRCPCCGQVLIPEGIPRAAAEFNDIINVLPEPLRRFIQDLEARANRGSDAQRIAVLEMENEALQKLLRDREGNTLA